MTITEKILAAHTGKPVVEPGEFINPRVDMLMGKDMSTGLGIREFERIGVEKVFDREKIALIPDHQVPNLNIDAARNVQVVRNFARKQGIVNFFELGRHGIEHIIMPEQGLVLPGELVLGADSHTVTYGGLGAFSTGIGLTDLAVAMATGWAWLRVPQSIKFVYHGKVGPWVGGKDLILFTIGQISVRGAQYRSMEFTGEAIRSLPMHGRFTMCNMAVEAGAKNGIVPPDEVTVAWVDQRAKRPYTMYRSDPDAKYAAVHEWDVSGLRPQVACPSSPANVKPVDEVGNVPIDQAFLGACTNGWLEDLRLGAQVMKGHTVNPNVRFIVTPGSQTIYLAALREGIIGTFIEAGAAVTVPTCGPCAGDHQGLLGEGERCISTSNRNFAARMGPPSSEVYLANPAVAAASAVLGRIASPEELR